MPVESLGESRQKKIAIAHAALNDLHSIAHENPEIADCVRQDLRMLAREAMDLAGDIQAKLERAAK